MKYNLHPEAEKEHLEAAAWYYQNAGPEISLDYCRALVDTIQNIIEYPTISPIISGTLRRRRMRRFPYHVVYGMIGDELIILSISHFRRSDEHWQNREE